MIPWYWWYQLWCQNEISLFSKLQPKGCWRKTLVLYKNKHILNNLDELNDALMKLQGSNGNESSYYILIFVCYKHFIVLAAAHYILSSIRLFFFPWLTALDVWELARLLIDIFHLNPTSLFHFQDFWSY